MTNLDPFSTPSPDGEAKGKLRQRSPRAKPVFRIFLLLTIVHGLAVWWSYSNASPGMWIMEGGSRTRVQMLADFLLIWLNFPLGAAGFVVARDLQNSAALYLMCFANSCLWGAVGAHIYTFRAILSR